VALHTARVAQALEHNAEGFRGYDRTLSGELRAYAAALAALPELSAGEMLARLPEVHAGARPSGEWDEHRRAVLPFERPLRNHEEARAWAAERLFDRLTFAADGSQIQPMPDVSVPVAAAQVGWFENPHNPDIPYVKDVRVEVLPPDRVFVERGGLSVFSDQAVSLRRFELEVEVLCEWMDAHAGVRPVPVAFFDGSLVVSFAERFEPGARAVYVRSAVRLLEVSERSRVPIVGYVDNSRARDLATMLGLLQDLGRGESVTDASLLASAMRWGDRTPAWLCDREGILSEYSAEGGEEPMGDRLAFAYLRTSAGHPPARLEFPRWVVEEGRVEDVVEVVRAEAVVGNGYPYALETADAVAVITAEDRRRFYRLFEAFAEKHHIRLRVASKMQSKLRRR
jgi:hypothetical protein